MPGYIPKIRVAVQIVLDDDLPLSGELSLASHAECHAGPETLLELLNASQRMLPFHVGRDGPTLLVARDAITWVAAGPETPEAFLLPRPFQITHEESLQIRLRDGRHIEGVLRMELPEHFNRPSDFFNLPDPFFAFSSGSGTLLVRKGAIREVRLFSESPTPLA